MFIGVSKNIGGFRVGIGTNLNTEPTAKELKDSEFKNFLKLMGEKTFNSLENFVNVSGYNYNELSKYEIDLDTLFVGSKKYDEFLLLLKEIEKTITRTLEIEDFGVVSKRKISDKVYKLEDFVQDYVDNYKEYLDSGVTTKSVKIDYSTLKKLSIQAEAPKRKYVGILFGTGIFLAPYIFSWFTLIPGYSKGARIISFIWLIVVIIMLSTVKETEKKEVIQPTKIEQNDKK